MKDCYKIKAWLSKSNLADGNAGTHLHSDDCSSAILRSWTNILGTTFSKYVPIFTTDTNIYAHALSGNCVTELNCVSIYRIGA